MAKKEYTVWRPNSKNKTSVKCVCPVKTPMAIEPTLCATCFKLLPAKKK